MLEALLTAELFSRAADLIEPEGCWIQRDYAEVDGIGDDAWHPRATCWCAEGAIIRAGGLTDVETFWQSRAYEIVANKVGCTIVAWNDAPGRTQAEVVSTLRSIAQDSIGRMGGGK